MCDLVRRVPMRCRLQAGHSVKDSRGSINASSKSGVPGKTGRGSVMELRRLPAQDSACCDEALYEEQDDAAADTRPDVLSLTDDGDAGAP